MTIYIYSRDEVTSINGKACWLNNKIHHKFDCVLAIRNTLQNHGHELKVDLFMGSVGDYEQVVPDIREVEAGYYITDTFDEINYAYFSKDMNSAKACAKAVLDVVQV